MTEEDRALLENAFALDDCLRADRQADENVGRPTICTKERSATDLRYRTYVPPEPEGEIFTEAQGEVLSRMLALAMDDAANRLDRTVAPLKAEIATLKGRVATLTALLGKQQQRKRDV